MKKVKLETKVDNRITRLLEIRDEYEKKLQSKILYQISLTKEFEDSVRDIIREIVRVNDLLREVKGLKD